MRIPVLLALLVFTSVHLANAQQPRPKRYTAVLAGTADLSATEDKYNAEVFSLEAPNPDANAEQKRLKQVKDEVSKKFPRKTVKRQYRTTATAQMPVLSQLYIADSATGIPPDNDMAISNDSISVSVVNSNISVHNASTSQKTYRRTLRVFANAAGLNNINVDYKYDPKVMYDPVADRFICVMLNSADQDNWIVVAFSKTNDPTTTWNFYKFYGDYSGDTTWFDYPSIAITDKEFFLTGNKIKYNTSWQTGFVQTVVYQIDKESGYRGDGILNYQIWDNIGFSGGRIRNMYPVKGGGSIAGPEQYFLSNRNFDIQNDTIFLVKLVGTIGGVNNSITITPLKADLKYGVPPQGRQPDTAYELSTNDGRILGAFREGDEIQFVSTTVHPSTGNSAAYHGVISNFATTPSVHATYVGVDTLDLGYPNISFAGKHYNKNHSIISFNYTGPSKYPGIGAVYFDAHNHSDMLDVKQGDSSIAVLGGKSQRWGDYMGSQPDWNALGNVWIEGIYGRQDREYGNYIAKLTSPYYGVADAVAKARMPLYPNPAFELVNYEFTLGEDAVMKFAIYDMGRRLIDNILEQPCKKGSNRLTFNTGSLATGIYILKGSDPQGKVIFTERFVKR